MNNIKTNLTNKSINSVDESTTDDDSLHNVTATTGISNYEVPVTRSTHNNFPVVCLYPQVFHR